MPFIKNGTKTLFFKSIVTVKTWFVTNFYFCRL